MPMNPMMMNQMAPAAAPMRLRTPMAGRMPINPLLAAKRPGGMKKGGSAHRASERADGCCEKGHTKGHIVMCGGGMAKK